MHIISSGVHTSSFTFSFLLYHLANNPQVIDMKIPKNGKKVQPFLKKIAREIGVVFKIYFNWKHSLVQVLFDKKFYGVLWSWGVCIELSHNPETCLGADKVGEFVLNYHTAPNSRCVKAQTKLGSFYWIITQLRTLDVLRRRQDWGLSVQISNNPRTRLTDH